MNARVLLFKSAHGIGSFQNNGRVGLAVQSRPCIGRVIRTVDTGILERDGCIWCNGNLHVIGQCAGKHITVLRHIVGGQRAEVHRCGFCLLCAEERYEHQRE